MDINNRENVIYIKDLMKHHINREKVNAKEYEYTKMRFEREVMIEALSYLNKAFQALKELEMNDDLLPVLKLIYQAFEKGEVYLFAKES